MRRSIYRDEQAVVAAIEGKLGHRVDGPLWDLVAEDYPTELEELVHGVSQDISGLVKRYLRVEAAARGNTPRPKQERSVLPPDGRLVVLSRKMAEEAEKEPGVRWFRERYLDGRVLPIEQVNAWIKEQEGGRDPATMLEGSLPSGEVSPVITYWKSPASDGLLECEFTFRFRDGAGITRVPIEVSTTSGTPLDELRKVSEDLAERAGWDGHQTTTFLITGVPPAMPRATARRQDWHFYGILRSRITLDVHPSTSPEEVMQIYRRERRRGWRLSSVTFRQRTAKRPLPLLIDFVEGCAGQTWEERRLAWNAAYPALSYGAASNMCRDYRRSVKLPGRQ